MRVRIVPVGWAGARGTLGTAGHDNVRYRSPIRLRRLSPAAPLPDDNAAAPDRTDELLQQIGPDRS